MFYIYFLISEKKDKTYIGFTNNLYHRIDLYHRKCRVKSTRNFGNFMVKILGTTQNILDAKKLEKYWKSKAGRNKLKKFFNKK